MNILQAIRERRSIRQFKSEPIPKEKLIQLLEAVRFAPSWANTQCWELILVDDPRTKELLAKTMPPGNPAIPAFSQAPLIVVGCAQLGKAGFFRGQPATDKGDWFMFDMGIALQNLCLAAYGLGLGTVHVGAFDAQKAKQILNVPEGIAVVEMVPVGFPDQEPKKPVRKEMKDFVFSNEYKKSMDL
jgi:nitroreductase